MARNSINIKKRYFFVPIFIMLVLAGYLFIKEGGKKAPTINFDEVSSVPTVSLNQTNTPNPPTSAVKVPSSILNLTNWKLTLPMGSNGDPTTIKQPQLASFTLNPWFTLAPSGGAVQFRAPVNGSTTENSDYPRSELREMTNNGSTEASWSSSSGKHTMIIDQAIIAVPKRKNHIVAGQIHDAKDDVIVIRLDFPRLYVNVDGKNVAVLNPSYKLGERFTVKFEAEGGKTNVYYNNAASPSHTLDLDYNSAYFKAGAYTQSNCEREGFSLCNEGNYGEVYIYQLSVAHQ